MNRQKQVLTNDDGRMISPRGRPFLVIVKVGDGAPIILLSIEDEHLTGSVGKSRRFRPKSTKNNDGFGFLQKLKER